jgi:hypothetical protein
MEPHRLATLLALAVLVAGCGEDGAPRRSHHTPDRLVQNREWPRNGAGVAAIAGRPTILVLRVVRTDAHGLLGRVLGVPGRPVVRVVGAAPRARAGGWVRVGGRVAGCRPPVAQRPCVALVDRATIKVLESPPALG